MPLTVVTVKNAPISLRGDLSKWMQEIATGVYVGNFNSRIREKLWDRIKENIGKGEATISYNTRNEIGYSFDTFNTERFVMDVEGIPLIFIPHLDEQDNLEYKSNGYSDASRNRQWRKYNNSKTVKTIEYAKPLVFIDIETDGLDREKNSIIEIGAVKCDKNSITEFTSLISYEGKLPSNIVKLTGITEDMLQQYGKPIQEVLAELVDLIGHSTIVGYGISFDIGFLNHFLERFGMEQISNKRIDLMEKAKRILDLTNYKLQTVLYEYDINKAVQHRALADAKLIYELFYKVM